MLLIILYMVRYENFKNGSLFTCISKDTGLDFIKINWIYLRVPMIFS